MLIAICRDRGPCTRVALPTNRRGDRASAWAIPRVALTEWGLLRLAPERASSAGFAVEVPKDVLDDQLACGIDVVVERQHCGERLNV